MSTHEGPVASSSSLRPDPSGPSDDDRTPVVLVVDDDRVSLLLLESIFERIGWKAICVDDPPQGLKDDGSLDVDAVVVDLLMPGMNGREFIEKFRARERGAHVPIVVWTSQELTPRELSALKEARGVVRKGKTGIDDLVEQVRRALFDIPPPRAAPVVRKGMKVPRKPWHLPAY